MNRLLGSRRRYAQPGGGNVTSAWRRLRGHAHEIRDFVNDGGNYLIESTVHG